MSYLDALKRNAKGRESEFIESDISQPSERKKRAQEKYNRLTPSQKRQVDKIIKARKSRNPQDALVKEQDARNESQQRMMSRLDNLNRKSELKRQEAETQAIEKQRRKIRLAEQKVEFDKAQERQKVADARAKIDPDQTADEYFDSVQQGEIDIEQAEFDRDETIRKAEEKLKGEKLLFGNPRINRESLGKGSQEDYDKEEREFNEAMEPIRRTANMQYDRKVKTIELQNNALIRKLIKETVNKFETFEEAQDYFRKTGLERELSRVLNEDARRRGFAP
tara:strand:+ start:61 stop:897 length:837 start_codon:yes stop_codon:yes gene_type:complete